MSCQIFRKNGKITKVLDPNGKTSKLYQDILKLPTINGNKEKALKLWAVAYEPQFKGNNEPDLETLLDYDDPLANAHKEGQIVVDGIKGLVKQLGFNITTVEDYQEDYLARTGDTFDVDGVRGLMDTMNKVVAYNGDDRVFIEEASHLALAALKKDGRYARALELVPETEMYKQESETYRQKYRKTNSGLSAQQLETKVRSELLGKILADNIIKKMDTSKHRRILRILRNLWDTFISKLKKSPSLSTFINSVGNAVIVQNMEMFDAKNVKEESLYFSLSSEEKKILSEAGKTLKKAINRLNERLTALKRRKGTVSVEEKLKTSRSKLQERLDKTEEELGLIDFLGYVDEDITTAMKYIAAVRNKTDKINSDTLAQLYDFINYYKPLIAELRSKTNASLLFEKLPEKKRRKILGRIRMQATAFSEIEDFWRIAHKVRGNNIMGDELSKLNFPPDFDLDTVFDTTSQDPHALQYYFGALRDVADPIGRMIYKMMADLKAKTGRETYEFGKEMIHEIINKRGFQKTDVFAEKDSDGNATGYFVTPYNLAEFYKSYDEFLESLRKKYDLSDNKPEPIDPKELQNYNKERNAWLADNVERRFIPEYYDLKNSLSLDAKEALDVYNIKIANIINEVRNIDGSVDLEKISQADWQRLEELKIERAGLASEYDSSGNKKTGKALSIAQEIKAYREKERENVNYEKDIDAFNEANTRKKVELSEKWYNLWKFRNTQIEYDERFYEELEKLEGRNYGPEYMALKEKRKDVMKKYRRGDMSVKSDYMSDELKQEIQRIDERMIQIIKGTKKEKGDGGPKLTDIADIVPSKEYFKAKDEARKKGSEAYQKWMNANHYDAFGEMTPYSYWTHLVPVDKEYILEVPSNEWSKVDPNSAWYNNNYNENWRGWQPKTSKWGSSAYNSLTAEQRSGLDYILKQKHELDDKLPISNRNAYMLPQISKSLNDILLQKSGIAKSLKELVKDKTISRVDDTQFGDEQIRERPDGTKALFVPIFFTRMLEDPSNVSLDLTSSMILYADMVNHFVNSTEKAADFHVLHDLIGERQYKNKNKIKRGTDTNLYKMIQTFLEMQIYGVQRERLMIKGHDVSKVLDRLNSYIRANNLMLNAFTTLAGWINGAVNSNIEDLVGRYTTVRAKKKAWQEYMANAAPAAKEMYQINKLNKMNLVLEYFRVFEDNHNIFDNLDKVSRHQRMTVSDVTYAQYKIADFDMKAKSSLAVMFNYRYHNGRFYTEAHYSKVEGPKPDYDELISIYDMLEVDEQKYKIKVMDEHKDKVTDEDLNYIENTTAQVNAKIDGVLTPLDKAKAHQGAVLQLFTTHRGWMFRNISDRWKAKGKNYVTGQTEEGYHRAFLRFLFDTVLHVKRTGQIRDALAMWSELDYYQKVAVMHTLYETAAVVTMTMLAVLINKGADEDDDNYALEFAAYLSNRVLLETSALSLVPQPVPYAEITQILNSPVAGTRQLETLMDFRDLWNFDEIEQGPYEGWPRAAKVVARLTPGLKGLMTLRDPESPNKYLKNKALRAVY